MDLEAYDFSTPRLLPLDGEWEFFWDKWIVTDNLRDAKADAMAHVPLSWIWYSIRHGACKRMSGGMVWLRT